jgi:glycosyltransferase involved in cell wall biosynthesis
VGWVFENGTDVRIAYISETFLPKVDGVVTRVLRTLEALDELGHDVLVLAPPGAPSNYRRFEVVSALGLPFPWYPELKVALPSKKLADTLKAFDPDLIHVINPVLFGLWGEILARRLHRPLVASFHTNPGVIDHLIFPLLKRPLEIFDREVHNLAHLSLCTSPQMVGLAREIGIKRVRLWPKAVDSDTFHPGKASADMRHKLTDGEVEKPLVIYIGRLSWEKRLELLVEAIPQLRQARWAFVGSGPAEADLRRRLADTPTVFTGYMSGEDLAQAYASADVFAFPSDTETLGFVVMEAMASGLVRRCFRSDREALFVGHGRCLERAFGIAGSGRDGAARLAGRHRDVARLLPACRLGPQACIQTTCESATGLSSPGL